MPRELSYTPGPTELDRLVEREGLVLYPAAPDRTSRPGVALWDRVTRDWTQPLPAESINLRLRKVTLVCLECRHAEDTPGHMANHYRKVRETAAIHREATIETGTDPLRGTYFFCSACGNKNLVRSRLQRHIEDRQALGGTHSQELDGVMGRGYRAIYQFVLSPPPEDLEPVPLESESALPRIPTVEPKTEHSNGVRRKRKHPHRPPPSTGPGRAHPAVGAGRVAPD